MMGEENGKRKKWNEKRRSEKRVLSV